MEYQYRSEVAERFGLIILDDMTVLNREGHLLINGKKRKEAPLMLPEKTAASRPDPLPAGAVPKRADPETT